MTTKAELVQILTNQVATDAALAAAVEAAHGTNNAMTAIGVGLVALSAVGYMWYRRVNSDRREDSSIKLLLDEAAKAAHMWRTNAEDAHKRADEANARADKIREESLATIERVAKERNEAVQEVGALRATVEHLQETVEELTVENKQLHQMLDKQGTLLHEVLANQARLQEWVTTMKEGAQ